MKTNEILYQVVIEDAKDNGIIVNVLETLTISYQNQLIRNIEIENYEYCNILKHSMKLMYDYIFLTIKLFYYYEKQTILKKEYENNDLIPNHFNFNQFDFICKTICNYMQMKELYNNDNLNYNPDEIYKKLLNVIN
jgi:hypothetical protein